MGAETSVDKLGLHSPPSQSICVQMIGRLSQQQELRQMSLTMRNMAFTTRLSWHQFPDSTGNLSYK